MFGKYAAPGILNSDDTHPSVDPDAATQHRDTRTVQQRQHELQDATTTTAAADDPATATTTTTTATPVVDGCGVCAPL